MKIYYNARCSKCRQALSLIKSKGKDAEIVDYLNNPPSTETLEQILKMLNLKPFDLVRKKEPEFIKNFKNRTLSDEDWLKVLAENPKLIERPIIIKGNKAVIGRPPEKVLDLI